MNKIWTFVGGVVTGVAGIVATAFIVSKFEEGGHESEDASKQKLLALPEGKSASPSESV